MERAKKEFPFNYELSEWYTSIGDSGLSTLEEFAIYHLGYGDTSVFIKEELGGNTEYAEILSEFLKEWGGKFYAIRISKDYYNTSNYDISGYSNLAIEEGGDGDTLLIFY